LINKYISIPIFRALREHPLKRNLVKKDKFFLLLLFVMLISITVTVTAKQSYEVYVYRSYEYRSPEVVSSLLNYFNDKSDWKVIEYDLSSSVYSENFFKDTGYT